MFPTEWSSVRNFERPSECQLCWRPWLIAHPTPRHLVIDWLQRCRGWAKLKYDEIVLDGNLMSLYKYFNDECHARAFISKGQMRFGSLDYYRGIEDGGVRGDPRDGMLHYSPAGGLEITMVADGRKLSGTAFTTVAERMFVYCASNDISAERAKDFGRFCVEIADPDAIVYRLKARESTSSRLDYGRVFMGATEYRPLDQIPAADWTFPERVVLIKPPEYADQNETRIVLPLKLDAASNDSHILVHVGNLKEITKLHVFD